VGVFKALVKLSLSVVIAAALAGVVMLMRRPGDATPVSFDQWPEVPRKPAT
jgi:hypothetical protein